MLLWFLGLATFISATLTGRVDFAFYWNSLKNYWNEFSDQQESMAGSEDEFLLSNASKGVYKNQAS